MKTQNFQFKLEIFQVKKSKNFEFKLEIFQVKKSKKLEFKLRVFSDEKIRWKNQVVFVFEMDVFRIQRLNPLKRYIVAWFRNIFPEAKNTGPWIICYPMN